MVTGVLSRVLSVLTSFSHVHPTRTLTEISHVTGIPLSTTHRLTAELVEWGVLERDEEGRFYVGLRLWELGVLAPRGLGLRDIARPFLEDLHAATGLNVWLAVLQNSEAVYVERIAEPDSIQHLSAAGTRMPLHASAVGLVLLANAPLALRQQVLTSNLKAYTKNTVTDPNLLREVLAQVRQQRFVVNEGAIEANTTSIAAPVVGPAGTVIAAVQVVIPAGADPRRYLPAVVTGARALSRALGARI